jgi:hypothetical protein
VLVVTSTAAAPPSNPIAIAGEGPAQPAELVALHLVPSSAETVLSASLTA